MLQKPLVSLVPDVSLISENVIMLKMQRQCKREARLGLKVATGEEPVDEAAR